MSVDEHFPEQLDLVDPSRVVLEAIGWQFGNWGAFTVLGATWLLATAKDAVGTARMVLAAALAAGGAMIAYEIRRRRSPTALVPGSDMTGIYRDGRFDLAIANPDLV